MNLKLLDKIAYIIIVCLILCLIAMVFIIYSGYNKVYKENVEVKVETIETTTIEKVEDIETEPTVETEPIVKTEPTVETEPIEEIEETIVAEEETVVTETEPVEIEPFFYLSDYERQVVECMVMGESGAEPYEGQVLVAQCILNACIKEGIQPSRVRTKYQYGGWHKNPSDSVKKAVSEVFDNGYKITEEFILYFYAPKYSSGRWHETQKFIIQVGGHKFFAEW
jgi:spore germination cell wall hydrolase CwlJ-like protein